MFNDVNRSDVSEFFENLVASDPRLSRYTKDLGVISLGNELGFKVDEAVKGIRNQFTEFYEPTSEVVLLAKLMYELGYIKLHKPLVVSITIKSDADVTLEKHQRFTDGIDIYIIEEAVNLSADVEHTILLTRGIVRTVTSTDVLDFSQSFVTESSDIS